jgi:hypothetical protein
MNLSRLRTSIYSRKHIMGFGADGIINETETDVVASQLHSYTAVLLPLPVHWQEN